MKNKSFSSLFRVTPGVRSWFCLNTSALETGCTQSSGVGQWNSQAEFCPSVKLIHSQFIPINFTGADNISFSTALHISSGDHWH